LGVFGGLGSAPRIATWPVKREDVGIKQSSEPAVLRA
jgi:hypothetical protein